MSAKVSIDDRIHLAALQLFTHTGEIDISVSELAQAAGVARGTIYNNLGSTKDLFAKIAARLSVEMTSRITTSLAGVEDPAMRLAIGIRLFVRRAHDEPAWGRFVNRYGLSSDSLKALWDGPTMDDVVRGIAAGRFTISEAQISSAMVMIGGSVLGAILLVLDGKSTWREASDGVATLVLVALGLSHEDAKNLASAPLPLLTSASH